MAHDNNNLALLCTMFYVFHLPLCSVWSHITVFICYCEVTNIDLLGRMLARFLVNLNGIKMHCDHCNSF